MNPQPDQVEALRLAAVSQYQVMDTEPELAFDEIAQFAADHFQMQIALISMIGAKRVWFKSVVGMPPGEVSRPVAFCNHTILGADVLVIEDAALDERYSANPFVTGEPKVRFYAGAPLLTPDGVAIGTLCVLNQAPQQFSALQRKELAILARQVISQLELRKRNLELQQTVVVLEQERAEQRRSQDELQRSLALLDNLTRQVPGVLYQYQLYPDGTSRFPYASQGVSDMYEVSHQDLIHDASTVFDRIHPDDLAHVARTITESAKTLTPWLCEYRVRLPRQGVRWRMGSSNPELLADGSILWHGLITDVTDRKRAEDEIYRLAFFDALTGLPNRRLLVDRAVQSVSAAVRNQQMGALIFLDLDHFKEINDSRGHAVGDELLKEIAGRLNAVLREDDSIARMGGDEFVVLLNNLGADIESASSAAMRVAQKLCEVTVQPVPIEGSDYSCTASLGVTLFPSHSAGVDDFLREADTAMYRAKEAGRNRIVFFEPPMQQVLEARLALLRDLQSAVAHQGLESYVQSQVDARGRITGGELLLRWKHPVLGFVGPNDFIPIAEESGLIFKIGEYVLRDACEALKKLEQAGHEKLSLSVNVSPRQFRQEDFVARIASILAQSGACGERLILEVTEGLLIDNVDETVARMTELCALGVRFSIDDFGTGYSSLSYIKRLPLYELKIDKGFVQDIPQDQNDVAIVQSILAMAKYLNLVTVAEGVETTQQADFLRTAGCDVLQGYLFGKPTPMSDWLELVCRNA
jgi:diguanylate cyclase (GGDEF)-like protein